MVKMKKTGMTAKMAMIKKDRSRLNCPQKSSPNANQSLETSLINLTGSFPVKAKMVTAHKNLSQGKVDKPGNKVRAVKAAKRVHRAASHLAKEKTYSRVKAKLGKVKQAKEKMGKANPDKAKRKLGNLVVVLNRVKVVGAVDLRKTYKTN